MMILCFVVGALLCLTCFFFILVHPLMCIVECAISKNLSSGQKALWIFLSFFVGIIGSLPYALFASGSTRIRSLTWNAMKFGALNLLLAIGVFVATPEIRDTGSIFIGQASMQSIDFESEEMADSSGEVSVALSEQKNESTQAEQPRFVSVVDPVPAAKYELTFSNLAEMAWKLKNNLENTSSLEDLVEDTTDAGRVPNSAWLPEANATFTVSQDSIERTPNKSVESQVTTDNSVASERQENPLVILDSIKTKTTDVAPAPQPELRQPPISVRTNPEKPSKKKPNNRYQTKDHDVEEITLPNNTMPQPLTVRNRYEKS